MMHPYSTQKYVQTLTNLGKEIFVPHWNCSVISRKINDKFSDLIGAYPICAIDKKSDLMGGLNYLKNMGFISIILVLDDFHRPNLAEIEKHFDFCHPYKTHFIHQYNSSSEFKYSIHHQYEIRKASRLNEVKKITLENNFDSWLTLYSDLVKKNNLNQNHIFPLSHHEILCKLKEAVVFGAWHENQLASCHIWIEYNGIAHSHLAASNLAGYKSSASYAVNDFAINYFKEKNLLNFGGCAGYKNDINNGLAKFKKGFCNETATSYLCGAILNQNTYESLLNEKNANEFKVGFFPAYR